MTSDLDSRKMDSNRRTPVALRGPKGFFKSTSTANKRIAKEKRKHKYDDEVRKKIETARARLDDSKSETARGRLDHSTPKSIAETTSVNSERAFSVANTSKDFPIIYFVVASNKKPFLANDFSNHSQRLHQMSHSQRARKAFYSKRVIQKRRMSIEKKRIRDLGADMGLRLEPIKSKVEVKKDVESYKPRHHTTPVSVSGKSDNEDTSVVNYSDDFEHKQTSQISVDDCQQEHSESNVAIEEHTKTNVSKDEYTEPNMGNNLPDDISQQTLELPVISNLEHVKRVADENVYALTPSPEGSVSTLKKVHFAEGLPNITGSKINLKRSETESEISRDIQRLKTSSSFTSVNPPFHLTSESSSVTRSMSEITLRSKVARSFKPMSLPKIDVMSPIYDELLLKTLETYCMGSDRGKPQCDANSLLHKMSAIFHPEQPLPEWRHSHRNINRSRLSANRRLVESSSDFITKSESNKYESELSMNDMAMDKKEEDTFLSSIYVDRRMTSVLQTNEKQSVIHTPVSSACFQMIPPGLTKEKSLSFQTLTKDI